MDFAWGFRGKTRQCGFELAAVRHRNSVGAFGLLQRRIGIGLDANVYLHSLFKTHFLTVLVSQGVLDANLAIKIVRTFNVDLRLFRLARNNWLDDLVDGTRQVLPFLAHAPHRVRRALVRHFIKELARSDWNKRKKTGVAVLVGMDDRLDLFQGAVSD